ncbi:MAG: family N-acetyltransferase [Solirubrobacterales bacterium]|nr:family N-acetyltransferase [Solirubrobacterales bacterium]
MSSSPRVWVAGLDEAEAVARLLVQFRDHMGRDWPSANAFLASVERLLEDPSTEFLLAAPNDDAPAAGVCQLRFRFGVWYAAPDCWLEDLYVTEAARGDGVGAALVGLAIDRARERGAKRVELDVSDANAPALALYERFGFRTGKEPGARDLLMRVKL